MGRVHSRLRSGDREAWLDSEEFFGELCADSATTQASRFPTASVASLAAAMPQTRH
jgi:hypothetical protein